MKNQKKKEISSLDIFSAQIAYLGAHIVGYARDFVGSTTGYTRFGDQILGDPEEAAIRQGYTSFYIRRMYTKILYCFNRPICSTPGAYIDVLPRVSEDRRNYEVPDKYLNEEGQQQGRDNGDISRCLNLSSYNYLGFADDWEKDCGADVLPMLEQQGTVATSCSLEGGYTAVHRELEQYVAEFLHKEDAIVYSMGYGTNTSALSTLITPGTAVLSDSLNHTSIVNGCRESQGAKTVPFKHNDIEELENKLQQVILCGKSYPKLPEEGEYKQWEKIIIVVEGIYSMEGEICELPEVVRLAKKYKAFVYVDEAHSIGALGATGRGICEQKGVDFDDVDVLMGTFSKSFGGMGGYIAASKEVIDKLRAKSEGQSTMSPLSTLIAKQVLTVFQLLDEPGGVGQQKIKTLKDNANYFRKKLVKMGCSVLGDMDSPVIPLMLSHPGKVGPFSLEMTKQKIAVVVVGMPATPMWEERARFCISAGHSKEDLREAADKVYKVVKLMGLRYFKE